MPRYLFSASLLALATAIPLTAFAADAAKLGTVPRAVLRQVARRIERVLGFADEDN